MRKKSYQYPAIKELIQWRSEKRLALHEAAKLFGMSSYQALWRWEVGFARIPAKRALTIAAATGIPVQVLRPDIWEADDLPPLWVQTKVKNLEKRERQHQVAKVAAVKEDRSIAVAAVKAIIPAIEMELDRKLNRLMGLEHEPGLIVFGSAAWLEYQV